MMYALVIDNTIQSVGGLPAAARRLDTGQWVMPPQRQWTDPQAAACGYLPVVDTPRPADTGTDTYDRSVELVAGQPTVVWTAREWTPEEQAARTEASNRSTIEQAAAAALDQNRTIITGADDYLAGHIVLPASPTTAQTVAAVKAYGAQVRALTLAAQWAAQQRQGLIRLALNQLDGTD